MPEGADAVATAWRQALELLEAADWAAAEGRLLHLRQELGAQQPAVADALAYALLMQGDFEGCAAALQPVLDHPQRSFWVAHKYADALRGLHATEAAVQYYRQALDEGSTSPLTARNLLEVLHELEPQRALDELSSWPLPLSSARQEGAVAAAERVSGLELAAWLQQRGIATTSLQRRLIEEHLLQLSEITSLWGHPVSASAESEPDQGWLSALQQRLVDLQLLSPERRDPQELQQPAAPGDWA